MSDRQTEEMIGQIARLVVQLGPTWEMYIGERLLTVNNFTETVADYPFTKYAKPRRYRTLQRIIDRLAEEL